MLPGKMPKSDQSAAYYREWARLCRERAKLLRDENAKRQEERLARSYEALAQQLDELTANVLTGAVSAQPAGETTA